LISPKVKAEIGIIGGSGLYDPGIIKDAREVKVYTPYGEPSDYIIVGKVEGRSVAFLPRHGRGHRIPPHKINYRANVWAMKELGVKFLISVSAVGSLRLDYTLDQVEKENFPLLRGLASRELFELR